MPPSGGPFDWTINTLVNIVTGSSPASETVSTWRFQEISFTSVFGPTNSWSGCHQTLALELGLYQLSYRTRESGFTSDKVPRWTVRCAADQRVLSTRAHPDIGKRLGLTTRTTVFCDPTNASVQTLRLGRRKLAYPR